MGCGGSLHKKQTSIPDSNQDCKKAGVGYAGGGKVFTTMQELSRSKAGGQGSDLLFHSLENRPCLLAGSNCYEYRCLQILVCK